MKPLSLELGWKLEIISNSYMTIYKKDALLVEWIAIRKTEGMNNMLWWSTGVMYGSSHNMKAYLR